MKIAKIALIAAFALFGLSRMSATEPSLSYYSYGWFGTSGYYPIEYWVDVTDPDGDLQSLSVSAHYESSNNWQNQVSVTGNGSHLQAHGYGDTVDGYTTARIDYADSTASYHAERELSF